MNTPNAEAPELDGKLVTMIAVAVVALVAVVVGAFVLSFAAITAVSEAAHITPGLSWLMATSVDGAMTVGTMTALVLKMLGKSTGYAWFVVLSGVTISIACNALHATQSVGAKVTLEGWQQGAVSAIPAVALALSLHLLILLIEAIGDAVSSRRETVEDAPQDAGRASAEVSVERLPQTVEVSVRERLPVDSLMPPTTLWGVSPEASPTVLAERLPQTPKDAERAVEDAAKDGQKDAPEPSRSDREDPPAPPSRPAPRRQPARPSKVANVEVSTKDKAMAIMAASPEMTAADLARELGLEPSGYVRTLRREVLTELAPEDAEDAAADASKDAPEDTVKDAPTDTAEDAPEDGGGDAPAGVSERRLHIA